MISRLVNMHKQTVWNDRGCVSKTSVPNLKRVPTPMVVGICMYLMLELREFSQHWRYLACGTEMYTRVKESSLNVTDTQAQIAVNHPFSAYSVTVTAVTVSPGPAATQDFTTEPQGQTRRRRPAA